MQDPNVASNVCGKCGGYGMYPCTVCEGSRRSSNNSHKNVDFFISIKINIKNHIVEVVIIRKKTKKENEITNQIF